MELLKINHVKKVYGKANEAQTTALKDVNLTVDKGEFVAIMGESGSGKSTLLNIIATLDLPSEGQVIFDQQNLEEIPLKEIAAFRRQKLGFVFQDFSLLETFNNKDNILLPLVLENTPVSEMEKRLKNLASQLGIEALLAKYPYEISGGQKQRIAVARALITEPSLLLADEPTGALDSKTSDQLMEVFVDLNQNHQQTIVMVTHSIRSAASAQRVLFIKDGIVFHEIYRGQNSPRAFQERITESLTLLNERSE